MRKRLPLTLEVTHGDETVDVAAFLRQYIRAIRAEMSASTTEEPPDERDERNKRSGRHRAT